MKRGARQHRTFSCESSHSRRTGRCSERGLAISPPALGSEQATCANWARDEWAVELSPDASVVLIKAATRQPHSAAIEVDGGRLVSHNRGEFGGEVWWEPASGGRHRVVTMNLVAFVRTPEGLFGLTGLAHRGSNTGSVVRFWRQASDAWSVESVLDLGGAPKVFVQDRDGDLGRTPIPTRLCRIGLGWSMSGCGRPWRDCHPSTAAIQRIGWWKPAACAGKDASGLQGAIVFRQETRPCRERAPILSP